MDRFNNFYLENKYFMHINILMTSIIIVLFKKGKQIYNKQDIINNLCHLSIYVLQPLGGGNEKPPHSVPRSKVGVEPAALSLRFLRYPTMAKHHPDLIFCRKQAGVGMLKPL